MLGYLTGFFTTLATTGFKLANIMISAIIFKIAYNTIIPFYFSEYVPDNLLYISYWHFVAFMILITFVGEQINKLVPKIIKINVNNSNIENE